MYFFNVFFIVIFVFFFMCVFCTAFFCLRKIANIKYGKKNTQKKNTRHYEKHTHTHTKCYKHIAPIAACKNQKITLPKYGINNFSIDCTGDSTCQGSQIYAPNTQTFTHICQGDFACKSMSVGVDATSLMSQC